MLNISEGDEEAVTMVVYCFPQTAIVWCSEANRKQGLFYPHLLTHPLNLFFCLVSSSFSIFHTLLRIFLQRNSAFLLNCMNEVMSAEILMQF